MFVSRLFTRFRRCKSARGVAATERHGYALRCAGRPAEEVRARQALDIYHYFFV